MTRVDRTFPGALWPTGRTVAVLGMTLALMAAVAALPGWTGIASVAWIALVVAFHRFPALGIAILGVAVPLQERFEIATVLGGASVTGYIAWALITAAMPIVARGCRLSFDRIALTHAIVITVLVASLAAGGVRVLTWFQEIYQWLLPLAIYVVCRTLRFSVRERVWIVGGMAGGVIVASAMGMSQAITGAGPESYQVDGMVRVFGTFGHPNTLASFLVIALPVLAAIAPVRLPGSGATWLIRFGLVAGLVALVLTQSRGGWLAFGLAVIFLIIMAPRTLQRVVVVSALAMVLLAVATGIVRDLPGASRFGSIAGVQSERVQVTTETWGQRERQAHWGAAWSMMTERPLFGVGPAEYNDNFREHTPEWRFRIGRGNAHNGYLHMGAQAGVPGLLAFTAWLGTILVTLARRVSRATGPAYALTVGATASATAYAAHSMFEYLDLMSLTILLAVVLAIALGDDGDAVPGRTDPSTPPTSGNAS